MPVGALGGGGREMDLAIVTFTPRVVRGVGNAPCHTLTRPAAASVHPVQLFPDAALNPSEPLTGLGTLGGHSGGRGTVRPSPTLQAERAESSRARLASGLSVPMRGYLSWVSASVTGAGSSVPGAVFSAQP